MRIRVLPNSVGAQFIAPTADYELSQNNLTTCRGRFIAPTADLSALRGYSGIRIILIKLIIGHPWVFRSPDDVVKPHHGHRVKMDPRRCRIDRAHGRLIGRVQ